MTSELRRLFDLDLTFLLENGDPVETVSIGSTSFAPLEVLQQFEDRYDAEYRDWLASFFRPQQEENLDEILALHSNRGRFEELSDAVARGQVAPFVGSGLSVPSGIPTWAGLLRGAVSETTCEPRELDALLASGHFEEAAALLEAKSNQNLMDELLEHALKVANIAYVEGPVRLLPAIFPKLAITTNLDSVLEFCYQFESGSVPEVLSGAGVAEYPRLNDDRTRFILKLHGDSRKPASRVLFPGEYEAAYGPRGSVRSALANLYLNKRMLFLGCSLGSDRTVATLRQVHENEPSMARHFALLQRPADEQTRVAREHQLTEIKIHPIWYDGSHDDAHVALLYGLYLAKEAGA
ncbi:SIR2 family protein [Demequina sp. NBRC 110052]|uniref:SIR2 family protein n=1 Tax=Demequina sp. NBRC 110052 TaxID=1570341 RepID=UPI000A04DB4F|nr:SIR2 family protein [Demequina sp. NBRC 110052]